MPELQPPPFGVWQSMDPMITMYIDPEYQQHNRRPDLYLGLYDIGETEIKINVFFGAPGRFSLYDTFEAIKWEDTPAHDRIFSGRWEVVEDQLHFAIATRYRERSGYEVIIFERLESYDPINPTDWFPPEDLPDDLEDS